MNILICNDDGYLAQGIALLARVAGEFANVRVVAPERDRSGASNSLTLDRPLRLRQAANGFYFVNGTPTDCIHIALYAMPEFKPDWVLSGVNHGANMGDDTLYSGTVAAATEAFLLGINAVAISLNDKQNRYWHTAEKALWQIMRHIADCAPPQPVLWNINIPAVEPQALRGWKTVCLGRRHHDQTVMPTRSPRGEEMYWIGAAGPACAGGEDTDFVANESGYLTITPLSVDLTDRGSLPQTAAQWQDFRL